MQVSAETASQEKNQAALSSVVAAVFLTTFKIVVGIATGSLGILAEAAHSGLDLVAALVTWFAVRIADRPPDQRHLYGHGKVENLSALFETLLLLVTCAWIIYEALQRLFVKEVVVDASVWAFLVMFVSIGIDFGRARVLRAPRSSTTARRSKPTRCTSAPTSGRRRSSSRAWDSCCSANGWGCPGSPRPMPWRPWPWPASWSG